MKETEFRYKVLGAMKSMLAENPNLNRSEIHVIETFVTFFF